MFTFRGASVCGEEVDLAVGVFVGAAEERCLAGPAGHVGFNECVPLWVEGGGDLVVGRGANVGDDNAPGW